LQDAQAKMQRIRLALYSSHGHNPGEGDVGCLASLAHRYNGKIHTDCVCQIDLCEVTNSQFEEVLVASCSDHSWWYYHVLWVSKCQRVSKCHLLRDRGSKSTNHCLDISPIYYLIINHKSDEEISLWLLSDLADITGKDSKID